MIDNADADGAYIAVGRNRRGADHWIVDRDVGICRTEIHRHGISGGGDIRGIRRVVNRGIYPNCEIECRTAAEQEGAPCRGQSADAASHMAPHMATGRD